MSIHIVNLLMLPLLLTYRLEAFPMLYRQNSEANEKYCTVLELRHGFSEDGMATQLWQSAIEHLRRHQDVTVEAFGKKPLTTEEGLWANLIRKRIEVWTSSIDSLGIPFRGIQSPNTVTILLGNQGGEDAFVYADSIICFDLRRLYKVYGSANHLDNVNRIDRFFAHEYTHVLHKAWRKRNSIVLDTPLDHALWECLTEGIGNYRSLSEKWVTSNGELSEHADSVLRRLQVVFVERIVALDHATFEEARPLMKGLSMGRFDQKWGALTVALWLAQEVKGDESNLQEWVDAGPMGILLLANKYLPEELRRQLPKSKH